MNTYMHLLVWPGWGTVYIRKSHRVKPDLIDGLTVHGPPESHRGTPLPRGRWRAGDPPPVFETPVPTCL